MDKPKKIWVVQYNLGGLSPVLEMTYKEEFGDYWDKTENFYSSGKDRISIDDGIVQKIFHSKAEANRFHKELTTFARFLFERYI